MDTDEEDKGGGRARNTDSPSSQPRSSSSQPRSSSSARRRRADGDVVDGDVVEGDLEDRINEIERRERELRTLASEDEDIIPGPSGLNLICASTDPPSLLSPPNDYNGVITVDRSLGVIRSRGLSGEEDEPPLIRRRLNPNYETVPKVSSSAKHGLSKLAKRISNARSSRPNESGSSSSRMAAESEDDIDLRSTSSPNRSGALPRRRLRDAVGGGGSAAASNGDSSSRAAGPSNRRNEERDDAIENDLDGRIVEIDDEPLIILDAIGAEAPQDLAIGRPLDLSREIVPDNGQPAVHAASRSGGVGRRILDEDDDDNNHHYGLSLASRRRINEINEADRVISPRPGSSNESVSFGVLRRRGGGGSRRSRSRERDRRRGTLREADNSARWRRFHVDDDDDAEDDEEEEVETVEDSAPEDEGDPPPGPLGAADVSDDDSDEDEDDVESDAATAGSSVSESRERALNVSMMPPSRVPSPAVKISPAPRVGAPTGAPAAVAAGAGAGTIPAEAAPSLPQEGENDAAAASRADRNAMPPPPPTAPILIPEANSTSPRREETASPGRFEERLSHTNHNSNLLTGLRGLRQEGTLCDFTLIADGQHFPVHKIVLCSCSDYFRAMFTQNLAESRASSSELHGVTSSGLRALLNFIYSGELTVSLDSVAEIVGAATHLQVLDVTRMCTTYLKRHLGLDNCVDVLALAELYSLSRLRDQCIQYLCLHLPDFISEENGEGNVPQINRLTHDQLQAVLKSNNLIHSREVEIFRVAVKWLKHSWEERHPFASTLMECIRFPLVTGEELVDVVEKEDFMSTDPQCHKFILEAYQYAILPNRQHLMQTPRTQVRSSSSLIVLGGPWDFVPIFPFPASSHRSCVTNRNSGINHLQWHQGQSSMVYKTNGAGVTTLDNYIFLIGGQISQEDRTKSGACYRYDPRTNKWLTLRPMNRARAFLAVVTKEKRIFAIGGQGRGSRPKSSCEVYDSISGEWTAIATLPQYALLASACNYRDNIYVSGGHPDAGILKLASDNTWENVAALPEARYRHTMLGAGNSLYIIGGRAIKHVGGRRQYPVPNNIVSYNLDTSSWSSFSLQPSPSTSLDPSAGPPPFDQAVLSGNRIMTLFSHPLLKAFHVHNSLYVVTKDSIYRSSNFPSPNGFGKWKFVASNPQTFTADMAFCLATLPPSSFGDHGTVNNSRSSSNSNVPPTPPFPHAPGQIPWVLAANQAEGLVLRNLIAGGVALPRGNAPNGVLGDLGVPRARNAIGRGGGGGGGGGGGADGNDEEILINWEILEG